MANTVMKQIVLEQNYKEKGSLRYRIFPHLDNKNTLAVREKLVPMNQWQGTSRD